MTSTYFSVKDYLAAEEVASVRHEYVNGRIFAMSGGTLRHNVIAGNIYSLFRSHLRGGPCRAYIFDIKVHVKTANCFYYPDVMVSCDPYDEKSVYTNQPVIIVEVLSPSTSAIDRREKVLAYRQIESLHEYLIVSQRKPRAELHRKNIVGEWEVLEFGDGDEFTVLAFSAEPMKITMTQIYQDLDGSSAPTVRENANADLYGESLTDDW